MAYTITTKDSRGEAVEVTVNLTPKSLAEFAASSREQQQLAANLVGQISSALIPKWQREAMCAASDVIEGLLAINTANQN